MIKVWECVECGYEYEGDPPPRQCPECGAPCETFEVAEFEEEEEEVIEWDDEDWGVADKGHR